jgi:hypothetical protein
VSSRIAKAFLIKIKGKFPLVVQNGFCQFKQNNMIQNCRSGAGKIIRVLFEAVLFVTPNRANSKPQTVMASVLVAVAQP